MVKAGESDCSLSSSLLVEKLLLALLCREKPQDIGAPKCSKPGCLSLCESTSTYKNGIAIFVTVTREGGLLQLECIMSREC